MDLHLARSGSGSTGFATGGVRHCCVSDELGHQPRGATVGQAFAGESLPGREVECERDRGSDLLPVLRARLERLGERVRELGLPGVERSSE